MPEVHAPRGPSLKTIKRLFAVSGNRCAFPKCPAELVSEGTIVGEICHIKAASTGGPRYDPKQSDEERHSFENLILLCGKHHTVVDDDVEAYTVSRLTEMKAVHEALAATMTEDDAARGATLLLSVNQSGGIAAHSVHAHTINVHQHRADTVDEGRANIAREYFAPELARIFARQIYILDRAVPNFICTSVGKPTPGDTWASLRPAQPILYPSAAEFRNLSPPDATSLIAFYNSLQAITDMVNGWVDGQPITDVNAWNVLMQRVQHNLVLGQKAVQRFCAKKLYDELVPVAGTLIQRSERAISSAKSALAAHLKRHGVS